MNINLLETLTVQQELYTVLETNAFINVINQPTRITPETSTLLDTFITNACGESPISGVLAAYHSDHLPIYLFMNLSAAHNKPAKQYSMRIQDINQYTLKPFYDKLSQIHWSSVYEATDADEAYGIFISTYKKLYFECISYKIKTQASKARKSWISKECLKAIRIKSILFKRFIKTKNIDDFKKFKVARNKANSINRQAKRN